MAGGSFLPPNDRFSGASDALWRSADSLNRANQTLGNLVMQGQMFAQGSRQTLQPVGDLMANMSRQLEALNKNISNSPLMSGRPLAGGAAMSGGQAWAASFGLPVQVPGLRAGEVGAVSRDARSQLAALATESAIRTGLTQGLPQLLGMGLAFTPGGAFTAPLAAGAAHIAMPALMRGTGIDAMLARESMTREIQRSIGERLGVGGIGERFRVSRAQAQGLTGGVTDFIRENQERYNVGGVLNFGLSAADYQPLVGAAMNLNTASGLKDMIKKGGKGMKEQLNALVEASAALGSTFEEVAELANAYGQTEGGARGFANFANQIERYAGAAGGGLDRRQLMGYALSVRDQARGMGLSGEMAMQNVLGLTSTIQSAANQRLLNYSQMASFGGNTEQERAQNMASSIFNMQNVLGQGPIGNLIRANMLGGRGIGAGMGGFGAFAGGAAQGFMGDPFGFINSQADPTVNQLVAEAAPFTYINQLRNATKMFGARSGQAARAMFIQNAGQFGMTAPQAGSVFDLYGQASDKLAGLAAKTGVSTAELTGKAMSYASRTGSTSFEVIEKLKTGEISLDQLNAGGNVFGDEGFAGSALSDAEINRRADFEASLTGAALDNAVNKRAVKAKSMIFRDSTGSVLGDILNIGGGLLESAGWVGDALSNARERDVKMVQTREKVRAELTAQNQRTFLTDKMRSVAMSHSDLFQAAGISMDLLGSAQSGAEIGKAFKGGALGYSKEFTSLVHGDMSGLASVMGGSEGGVVLDTLNARLRGLASQGGDAYKEIQNKFGDIISGGISKDEASNTNRLSDLMRTINEKTNGSLLSSLAFTAVVRKENDLSAFSRFGNSIADSMSKVTLKVQGIGGN